MAPTASPLFSSPSVSSADVSSTGIASSSSPLPSSSLSSPPSTESLPPAVASFSQSFTLDRISIAALVIVAVVILFGIIAFYTHRARHRALERKAKARENPEKVAKTYKDDPNAVEKQVDLGFQPPLSLPLVPPPVYVAPPALTSPSTASLATVSSATATTPSSSTRLLLLQTAQMPGMMSGGR